MNIPKCPFEVFVDHIEGWHRSFQGQVQSLASFEVRLLVQTSQKLLWLHVVNVVVKVRGPPESRSEIVVLSEVQRVVPVLTSLFNFLGIPANR